MNKMSIQRDDEGFELVDFSELKGKVIDKIKVDKEPDTIIFYADNGDEYMLCHDQNCCESVTIDDICGDLDDLMGLPILLAEEATNNKNPERSKERQDSDDDSFTWTFYKLATNKGYVTIRWYGVSNGYYSENVSFWFKSAIKEKVK